MTKFVWLTDVRGMRGPVNPDRVAYLREGVDGKTHVVFDGIQGGFHEMIVMGTLTQVTRALESAAPGVAPKPRQGKRNPARVPVPRL